MERTLALLRPSSGVRPNAATPLDPSTRPSTIEQGDWTGTLFVRALGGRRHIRVLLLLLLPLLLLPLLP
ncbi:MAG: hypothetical protein B7Z66_15010 [Chromatiales bacterium 21-64-14]|nr:MAG: hypothetical protein B7Z66_15010 [Chromatiales bacterium 21-64-14]